MPSSFYGDGIESTFVCDFQDAFAQATLYLDSCFVTDFCFVRYCQDYVAQPRNPLQALHLLLRPAILSPAARLSLRQQNSNRIQRLYSITL